MTDVVETAIYKLGVEGQPQLDQAATALDKVAGAEERVVQATEKVTRATRTSAESLERMAAAHDKTTRATAQYARGLEQIRRLEEEQVGTATRRGQVVELVTQKYNQQIQALDGLGSRLQQLTAKFDPATASAQKMTSELAELNEAVKLGVNIIGGYTAAFDRIVEKYDSTTEAAQQLANEVAALDREMSSIAEREKARTLQLQDIFDKPGSSARRMAREIADLNEAVRRGITIEHGYDAVLERIIQKYDLGAQAAKRLQAEQQRLIESGRQAQAATNAEQNQQDFSASQGIRPAGGGTGGAGGIDIGALEEAAAKEDRLAASLQQVRDALNPLLPIQRAHTENLKILDELLASGLLPLEEYRQALARANGEFARQSAAATSAAQAQKTASQAQKEAAQEQERLARAAQSYLDKLNPLLPAERAHAASLKELDDLLKANLLDTNAHAASVARATADYQKQLNVLTGVTAAEEKEAATQKELAADAATLKNRIDPLGAAQRAYTSEVARANELLKAKLITDRDHAAAVTMAGAKLADFSKAARGSTSEADLLAQTNRRMTATVTNLSFQLNDVVTGLVSGQQPMRILAQQGGQIVQAFQQSPGGAAGALAAFRTFLTGLITPTTVAVAGLAALGTGLLLVLNRAVQLETQMRTFNVILKGFGAEGETSALGLEQMETNLKAIGIAADDAREALLKVIRTPGVNRGAAESIVRTAAGLGVLTGAGTLAENDRLRQLVADQDVDALIKLGVEYGRLSAPTAKFIRDQKELHGAGVATNMVYAEIAKNMRDVWASSLGTFAKAINDLKNAWDLFLKDAAVTSEIQRFIADLKEMLASIREVLGYIEQIRNLPKTTSNFINERGDEATKRALEAQQEMIDALAARDREAGITPPRTSPLTSPRTARSTTMPDGSASSTAAAPAKATAEELAAQKATADQLDKNNDLLNKQTMEYNKLNAARRLYGLEQVAEEARIRGLTEAVAKGITGQAQKDYADRVADQARKERLIDLDKEARTQALTNELVLKTAQAYGTSLAAGLRAAAEAQGILDQRAGNAANARQREILLLRTAAAEQVKTLAEQGPLNNNAIAAQERLAAATQRGTAAAKDAEIQNEAVLKTDLLLAQATALQDERLKNLALAYRELFVAQGRAKEAATQTAQAFAEVNRMGRDLEVAQLEQAMVGRAPEDVTRAISLLRGAQQIADQFGKASSDAKDAYAEMVANLANAHLRLTRLREEQERSNRLFQGIASTIESTLGSALDDVFAGKKIDDWGARLKSMWASVQSTIAKETLLKPLIGTGLKLFGADDSVVKQYGTFKGLFGDETPADATGKMVKEVADGLRGGFKEVKEITVAQATINVQNAAGAVAAGGGTGTGASAVLTGPITQAEAGTAEAALTQALTHEGERLKSYCAKLVNEALDAAGVPGTGSGLASSFKTFGTPVDAANVRRGDVFYAGPSGWGDTGHVGFATGPSQGGKVPVFSSHISGPPENPAGHEMRSTEGLMFRRPDYAASTATATLTQAQADAIRAMPDVSGINPALAAAQKAAAEKAAQAQRELNDANQQGAKTADQAAQAIAAQANDNQKLATTAAQASAPISNVGYELDKTTTAATATGTAVTTTTTGLESVKTAMAEGAEGSSALATSVGGATTSIQTLSDGVQIITTDVPLATTAARELGAGAVEAASNLETQKNATADTAMSAQQAGEFAKGLSGALDSTGASASSVTPNIQSVGVALDSLDQKVQQSAVGIQQAANTAANAAAVSTQAAGASNTSLSSIASSITSASRAGQGGFSMSSLTQGAGLLDKLLGTGSSGSASGFMSNPFGLFATPASKTFAPGIGAGEGIGTNLLTGATSDVAGSGVSTGMGSLFGSTTFSQFTGGIGMGMSAGGLLNGLMGGNSMFGTIGSGIGSIAGSFLGPIGGLIGGALGGLLGGMFGAKKPPNQSAGGSIDFATGQVTGTFMGGNREIDQATKGALTEISAFTKDLLRMTGGTLTGNVLLQGGVNTGFTADSTVPGYEGRFNLGKDAAEAVRVVELALARTLEGVSESMKTVINSVTDPAQLRDAIEFAMVYDKLKEAYDTAFSSINQDTQLLGPFSQALDQLNSTFEELTMKAGQYGLALEPVTAGLAEAVRRLKIDFQTALAQQEAQLVGGTDYLGTALAAHQQQVMNWSDSVRLGFDTATDAARVNAIELAQLGTALSNLSLDQLLKAIETFAESAPEIADFAVSLINAGQYLSDPFDQLILAITDPVSAAIEAERIAGEERVRIAVATGQDLVKVNQYNSLLIQQIWDQATQSLTQLRADLTTGAASGLTAAEQVSAASDTFNTILAAVEGGNLSQLDELASAGASAIQLSEQTYGNAPQTAALRDSIVSAIDRVLANTQTVFTASLASQQQAMTPEIQAMVDAAFAAADAALNATDAAATTVTAAATVTEAAAVVATAAADVANAAVANDNSVLATTSIPVSTVDLTNVSDLSGSAAGGMFRTPPGTILVGERGPELISQRGGLQIWSNPDTQRILSGMPGRHFAEGTMNLAAPPQAPTNDELKAAIASLSAEVRMLRQQSVRTQQIVGDEQVKRLDRIAGGVEEGNRPAFEPPARRRA